MQEMSKQFDKTVELRTMVRSCRDWKGSQKDVCGADAVRVWKKQVGTTAAAQAYVYKRKHLFGYQAGEQVWGR